MNFSLVEKLSNIGLRLLDLDGPITIKGGGRAPRVLVSLSKLRSRCALGDRQISSSNSINESVSFKL